MEQNKKSGCLKGFIITIITLSLCGLIVAGYYGLLDRIIPIKGIMPFISAPEGMNVVIMGLDKEGYRTDVLMLAGYDPKSKKLNILQIPRDTYVNNKRNDKKINSAYASGEQCVFDELGNILGISLNKYMLVDLEGFRRIIDELGGVEMDIPIDMKYDDPFQNLHINLKNGHQVLDGKKAEMFVRFRKNNDDTGYPEGDIGRVKAQKQFLNAVMDKSMSINGLLKAPKLLSISQKYIKTNLKQSESDKYIRALVNMKKEDLQFHSLPGTPEYINGISYFVPQKQEAKKLASEYFTFKGKASPPVEAANPNTVTKAAEAKPVNTVTPMPQAYKPSMLNGLIKVEVLNGCDLNGADSATADALKKYGFNVIKTGKLQDVTYKRTVVIAHGREDYANEVAKALGGADVQSDDESNVGAHVTVIIGMDKS